MIMNENLYSLLIEEEFISHEYDISVDFLSEAKNLKRLELNTKKFKYLDSMINLEELSLGCYNGDLSFLSKMKNLRVLDVPCHNISRDELEGNLHLEVLKVNKCEHLEFLKELPYLESFSADVNSSDIPKNLRLKHLSITELDSYLELPFLEELNLTSYEKESYFSNLLSLEKLSIWHGDEKLMIPPNVKDLMIIGFRGKFPIFNQLESLIIDGNNMDISNLENMINLKKLDIIGFVPRLCLKKLTNLKYFRIFNMEKGECKIELPSYIEEVNLCGMNKDLSLLKGLKNLKKLSIEFYVSNTEILSELTSLEELDIRSECCEYKFLDNLKNLKVFKLGNDDKPQN